jgi:hypothetical protein
MFGGPPQFEAHGPYDTLVAAKLSARTSPADTLRAASLELGGIEQVKETHVALVRVSSSSPY